MRPTQTPRSNPRWRHATGRAAEEFVARHLEQRGCRVLAQRFACRGGEVDLIVDDGGVLAFVEVKARRSDRFGHPAEAVTRRKQQRMRAAAARFLRRQGRGGRPCRFDVCCVRIDSGRAEVEWLPDAFR